MAPAPPRFSGRCPRLAVPPLRKWAGKIFGTVRSAVRAGRGYVKWMLPIATWGKMLLAPRTYAKVASFLPVSSVLLVVVFFHPAKTGEYVMKGMLYLSGGLVRGLFATAAEMSATGYNDFCEYFDGWASELDTSFEDIIEDPQVREVILSSNTGATFLALLLIFVGIQAPAADPAAGVLAVR